MLGNKTTISGKHVAIFFTIFFLIICIFYTVVFINAKNNPITTKQSQPQSQSQNANKLTTK